MLENYFYANHLICILLSSSKQAIVVILILLFATLISPNPLFRSWFMNLLTVCTEIDLGTDYFFLVLPDFYTENSDDPAQQSQGEMNKDQQRN